METIGKNRYRVAILALVLAALFAQPTVRITTASLWNDLLFALRPTAERAAAIADKHLGSHGRADLYDIDRAERFYREALRLDPNHVYAYHQLARIEFLRGNFNLALLSIERQIALHGDTVPNAHYVRGLILGYMGRYADAASAYEVYLQFDPYNWAAINDYAWVLLKEGRSQDAANVTTYGLHIYPENAWLLTSNSIALFEFHLYDEALEKARAAQSAARSVTSDDWLHAYPGNDPLIARAGLAAFRTATDMNVHRIERAIADSAVQSE